MIRTKGLTKRFGETLAVDSHAVAIRLVKGRRPEPVEGQRELDGPRFDGLSMAVFASLRSQ